MTWTRDRQAAELPQPSMTCRRLLTAMGKKIVRVPERRDYVRSARAVRDCVSMRNRMKPMRRVLVKKDDAVRDQILCKPFDANHLNVRVILRCHRTNHTSRSRLKSLALQPDLGNLHRC